MLTIVICTVLLIIAVGCFVLRAKLKEPDQEKYDHRLSSRYEDDVDSYRSGRRTFLVVGLITGTLCVVGLLFSMVYQVNTREVGIVLTFKKPTGTQPNGVHVKAPWQSVESMDAAIQTDNHVKGGKTSDGQNDLNCITVRIAHQATSCVDTSVRWRIKEKQAGALFQNYRTFDNVRDSLVTRDLQASLNTVFETYDVLAVDDKGQSTAPQLSDLGAQVQQQLAREIGDQIEVLSVIIPVVHLDANSQSRVNALQAQISQTRIAQQAEQTATAQAAANKALAASVSNDPNVLVSKCLDLVNEAISKGYQMNATFNCFGTGSNVVVPAK